MTKLSDIFKEEIIIPSKINYLTLREIEYLYPEKVIPNHPKGLTMRSNGSYVAQRDIDGKKHYITCGTDISEVLTAVEKFCKTHNIEIK